MGKHVISNGSISRTTAFFAYVILIVGLLAAGAFLLRFELMPRTVLTAAIIAVGAVSSSFPMLAISRILEKVSAYNHGNIQSTNTKSNEIALESKESQKANTVAHQPEDDFYKQ